MLLRDAIVGTNIELMLLVEGLRITHGEVATKQIVLACTIGIGTLSEHTTGSLIHFGVERRVLGRQEIIGGAAGVGNTYLSPESQCVGNRPFHREVVDEGEILRLVDRIERGIIERIANTRGAVVNVVKRLDDIAIGIVRIVVGLHVHVIGE